GVAEDRGDVVDGVAGGGEGRIDVDNGVVADGAADREEADGGYDAAVGERVVGATGEHDARAGASAASYVDAAERGLLERDVDVGAEAVGLDRLAKHRVRVKPGAADGCLIRDGDQA